MRTPLLALATSVALLLPACSNGNEEGGPAEGPVPEFAADGNSTNEGVVGRGDVSQRPPAAGVSTLSIDGAVVPLRDGSCLEAGVPIEGVTGFQAALAEEDGSLDIRILPDQGTATISLTRGDATSDYPDVRAEVVNGAWYLESQATGDQGEIPQVIVNFTCPEVDEVGESPGNLQNENVEGPGEEEVGDGGGEGGGD